MLVVTAGSVPVRIITNNENNNNKYNNLILLRRKLAYGYDQMRRTLNLQYVYIKKPIKILLHMIKILIHLKKIQITIVIKMYKYI